MTWLGRWLNPGWWWDVVIASDPGLTRFRQAGRTTLAAGVAALLLFRLLPVVGQSSRVAFVGVYVAMMSSMLVNDPTTAAQRLTTLLVTGTAAAAVALGTVVAPLLWLNNLLFVVVIFTSVLVRQFGPRYLAMGMMAFMGYFASLYFRNPISSLPWMLAGVGIGGAVAYVLRFWIFRDRPETVLKQHLSAYHARVRLVLGDLADVVRQGRLGGRREKRVRAALVQLNDQAGDLQDQLQAANAPALPGWSTPALREQVFEVELSVEDVAEALWRLLEAQRLSPPERDAVSRSLYAARAAWPVAPGPEERPGSGVQRSAAEHPQARAELDRLWHALEELMDLTHAPRRPPEEAAVPPDDSPGSSLGGSGGLDARTALRQAVQASVAGGLAMAAGEAISHQRWFWAVIASFVIFTRTTTRGQTLLKAGRRILGTLAGIGVGLGVAEAVHGHRDLEVALVFLCIFWAFYLLRISYAGMILWFTILLSVLYSLLGYAVPGLLVLRLLETLVGATLGGLTAAFVFPLGTTHRVRQTAGEALETAGAFLETALVRAGSSPARLLHEARGLDRKLKTLRDAASSWQEGLSPDKERTTLFHDTAAVIYYARRLARAPAGDLLGRPEVREVGTRLADNARALARKLEDQEAEPLRSAADLLDRTEQTVGDTNRDTPHTRTLHWLRRMDHLLQRLGQDVGIVQRRG